MPLETVFRLVACPVLHYAPIYEGDSLSVQKVSCERRDIIGSTCQFLVTQYSGIDYYTITQYLAIYTTIYTN